MDSYTCPYCKRLLSLHSGTHITRRPSFSCPDESNFHGPNNHGPSESCIQVDFVKCPNCQRYSIFGVGLGSEVKDLVFKIKPVSSAIQFPDYIPVQIRNDYEEACAIVDLSPKASAAMSRRCLQGMIRDYWGISKNRLIDEISALEGKIPAAQWSAINRLRSIGNIGAHMENDVNMIVDIEPKEATALIKLIELLIQQWYINRHEQELLYAEIEDIYQAKEDLRHP